MCIRKVDKRAHLREQLYNSFNVRNLTLLTYYFRWGSTG